MINGADFLKIKNDYKKFLDKNFKNNTSSFSIIRIAAHYNDVDKILKYVKYLKKLGFKICLNLMQINNVTKKDLRKCLKKLELSKSVDVFYFADSFGNLKPKDGTFFIPILLATLLLITTPMVWKGNQKNLFKRINDTEMKLKRWLLNKLIPYLEGTKKKDDEDTY